MLNLEYGTYLSLIDFNVVHSQNITPIVVTKMKLSSRVVLGKIINVIVKGHYRRLPPINFLPY